MVNRLKLSRKKQHKSKDDQIISLMAKIEFLDSALSNTAKKLDNALATIEAQKRRERQLRSVRYVGTGTAQGTTTAPYNYDAWSTSA